MKEGTNRLDYAWLGRMKRRKESMWMTTDSAEFAKKRTEAKTTKDKDLLRD